MLTPKSIVELVMSYYAKDDAKPDYVADLVLDGIKAGGYIILKRDDYLDNVALLAAKTINEPVALFRTEIVESVLGEGTK